MQKEETKTYQNAQQYKPNGYSYNSNSQQQQQSSPNKNSQQQSQIVKPITINTQLRNTYNNNNTNNLQQYSPQRLSTQQQQPSSQQIAQDLIQESLKTRQYIAPQQKQQQQQQHHYHQTQPNSDEKERPKANSQYQQVQQLLSPQQSSQKQGVQTYTYFPQQLAQQQQQQQQSQQKQQIVNIGGQQYYVQKPIVHQSNLNTHPQPNNLRQSQQIYQINGQNYVATGSLKNSHYIQNNSNVQDSIKGDDKNLRNSRTSLKTTAKTTKSIVFVQPSSSQSQQILSQQKPVKYQIVNNAVGNQLANSQVVFQQQQPQSTRNSNVKQYFQIQSSNNIVPQKKYKTAYLILDQVKRIRQLELELQKYKISAISQNGMQPQQSLENNNNSNQQWEAKLQDERKKFSQYQVKFEENTTKLEQIMIEQKNECQHLREKISNLQKFEILNQELRFKLSQLENEKSLILSEKTELQNRLNMVGDNKYANYSASKYNSQNFTPMKVQDTQFRSEIEDLKTHYENRISALNLQLQAKEADNQQKMQELQVTVQGQQHKEMTQRDTLNRYETQILNVQNEKALLEKEIQYLKVQAQEQTPSNIELKRQQESEQFKQSLEQTYMEKITHYETQITTITTEKEQFCSKIQEHEQQKIELHAEKENHKSLIQQLELKIKDLEQNLVTEKNIATTNNTDVADIQQKYENMLIEEKQSKQQYMEKSQIEIQEQQQQIQTLLEEKHSERQQLEEKIVSLESTLQSKSLEYTRTEQLIQEHDQEVKELTQKVAIQEDMRKEQEDQYKKLLKQKDVELQIIHDDFELKIRSALQDQSMDMGSQKDALSISERNLLQQNLSFKKTEKSKRSKNTNKQKSALNRSSIQEQTSVKSVTSSQRSKAETRSMYKKMSQMSVNTAAMMSSKLDYNSLKELTKSNCENMQEEIQQAEQQIIEEHQQMVQSQLQQEQSQCQYDSQQQDVECHQEEQFSENILQSHTETPTKFDDEYIQQQYNNQ